MMPEIQSLPRLHYMIADIERQLGQRGRVLLRFSGTEPLVRVMVEGEDASLVKILAHQLAEAVDGLCA